MKWNVLFIASIAMIASSASADEITDALAGKTLSAPGQKLTAHADGRLTGKVGANLDNDLLGTWEIKDGKWCRTLTKPAAVAGSACQNIKLGNGVVTIEGNRGPIEYNIN